MPPKQKFQVDYKTLTTAKGEPLSMASIAIYKAALNRVALDGFKNKEELLSKQNECVNAIEARITDKAKRRVTLSAIFRVLQDVPNEKRVAYYKAFQRAKDTIDDM